MFWLRNNAYFSDEEADCSFCKEKITEGLLIENNKGSSVEVLTLHFECYPKFKNIFLKAYSLNVFSVKFDINFKKGYVPYMSQPIEITNSRRDCFDVADEQEPGVKVIDHTNPLLRMDRDSPLLIEEHQKKVQERIDFLDKPLNPKLVDKFLDDLRREHD